MNSRNFYSSNKSTSQTFPKASEQQTKPRLKAPDLSTELFKDQKIFYQYDTSNCPPPFSTTNCFVHEVNNTDPNLLRSTMYVLPNNTNTFESLYIPFGVSITPFNFKSDCQRSFCRTKGLICDQCRGYANRKSIVSSDYWICNFCLFKNKLSTDFEVKYPTLELTSEIPNSNYNRKLIDSNYFYMKLFKMPVFVFILDITTDLVEQYVNNIIHILEDETFKHLYKKVAVMIISNSCSVLKQYGDEVIECTLQIEPYLSPDIFFNTENIDILKNFLINIEHAEPHRNHVKLESSLLKIVNFAIGSKVAIFSNTIFDIKEIDNFIEASSSIYIFTTKQIDSSLPLLTNGKIYYYAYPDFYKSKSDLINICTSETAFDVQIEVKTSNGISKKSVYANTKISNLTNVNLSSMDSCSTITYTFNIDELISEKYGYIQFIVNYFSHDGLFKTRILNQEFKITKDIAEVYNGISFDSLFSCFCKYISENIENIKNVETIICKFLKYYRKSCCKDVSSTQFVLPESTKLLPVLYQSLIKNKIFTISSNELNIKQIVNFTVEQNLRFFYPRLFTLTDYYCEQDISKIKYLKLSFDIIESTEVYILENSLKIYLYIGKDVDPNLKHALFNNEDEKKVIMKIVEDINGCYGYELPVVVVEEGKKGNEIEFFGFMVEDSLNGVCSYYDYVCELHFKVQKI